MVHDIFIDIITVLFAALLYVERAVTHKPARLQHRRAETYTTTTRSKPSRDFNPAHPPSTRVRHANVSYAAIAAAAIAAAAIAAAIIYRKK